jgi:hypothetical protein
LFNWWTNSSESIGWRARAGLTLEARHALRHEESKPILERIKVSIEAARSDGLPQSVRTKACEYTLKLWNRLTRFLDHPELELSNNATEKLDAPGGHRQQELDPRRK